MAFFRDRPNISQYVILPKIQKFLTLQKREPAFIEQFSEGYCAGFACLALYARWLQFQPDHDPKNADDWNWMQGVLKSLSSWKEEGINTLSKNQKIEIERLISLIEYFHCSCEYQPIIEQGEMQMTIEDTKKRKLKRVYSVALCLKSEDFTKSLHLADQDTSLLSILTQEEDSLVLIDSYHHTTGLLKHGDNFYFYDANSQNGFVEYSRQQAEQLVTTILKAQGYDSNNSSPFPFYFRVFSFREKTPTYPSQQDVLAKLKPVLSPQQGNWDDTTALHMASGMGCLSSIEYYLQQKADVNVRMKEGITPLYIAAQTGQLAVVELLLNAKADVNIRMKKGITALFIAAQNGHTEVVELLLKARADVNAKTTDGETVFDVAANDEIMQLLLTHTEQQKSSPRFRS